MRTFQIESLFRGIFFLIINLLIIQITTGTLMVSANCMEIKTNSVNNQFFAATTTSAPIFWIEDFTLANGTITDNGTTGWAVSGACGGTFSVQNNEFMASFSSACEGVWASDVIDISAKSNVVISVDLRSETASTSDYFETSDYINVYYKLNGGAETLIYGDVAGLGSTTNTTATTTAISSELNGSTLQVVIRLNNSHPTERYYFDNVKLNGIPACTGIDASASVSGSLTCENTSVTLQGSSTVSGAIYSWTGPNGFSSELQNPSVSVPGTYILRVTDPSNNCYSEVTTEVLQITTPPGASASADGQISCTNSMVTLLGSSPTSDVLYSWEGPGGFESALQNPSVNTPGTYTLTVKNPLNGCTSIVTVDVIEASSQASTFWHEDFSLPNNSITDSGTTGWSVGTSCDGTFSVQNNEFMASFNSACEGVWASDVIDISLKNNVVISVDLRSATASTSDYLESNDYIRVFYKLDNGPEILMYEDYAGLGSTTNTTASATVTSGNLGADNLQVVVRLRNSHSTERYYLDNVKLTGSDQTIGPITTTVSGSLSCPNPSVQLTASTSTPATYYWICPDNTIINEQNPNVNKPGKYNVVVSVGGCQASKTVIVTGSTQIPEISISGDRLIRLSNVPVVLSAVSSNTNLVYSWSGPAGFTSDIKSPSVLNAGTYSVIVTDQANLCTNTAFYKVQYGDLLWNEEFEGLVDGTKEDHGSTAWSVDNSQIHTVDLSYYSSESGIPYYFEVKNNKLTAKSTFGEVVWLSEPINISGETDVFVRLDVSGEGSLNDSTDCGLDCFDYDYIKVFYKVDGGIETPFQNMGSIPGKLALSDLKISTDVPEGDILQIIIKAYNTGNSEIFYFDNIQVLAGGEEQVEISVSGPITCDNRSVTLSASPIIVGDDYNWSGPNGFVSDEPVVDVSQEGTYTLIVIGNSGYISSDTLTIEVEENTELPDISINSTGILTCSDSVAIIKGISTTQNVSYSWIGPGNFSSILQNISVDESGEYKLTVENDSTGCIAKDSITITSDTISPANVTVSSSGNLTCINNNVILTGNTSTNGVEYAWYGSTGFIAHSQKITIHNADTYELIVTDTATGCSSMANEVVANDTIAPGASAYVDNSLDCSTYFVTLRANSPTSGVNYNWAGPLNYSSSQQYPVTTIPGNYTVTTTNPVNGCTSTAGTIVEEDYSAPTGVSASVSGMLNCENTSVTLIGTSGTSGVSFSWSGPNGFISYVQNAQVFEPGKYTLTVTDTINQCTSSANVTVEQEQVPPEGVSAKVSGILTCVDTSVVLSGSSTTSGVSYLWTGPNNFSSGLQEVSVTVPGNYILEVSGSAVGCKVYDTVLVGQNITPPADVIASVSDTLDCNNTPVELAASSSTDRVYYSWIGPYGFVSNEQNPMTVFEGEYTVTVTNPDNGCSSEEQVIVIKEECQ